MAGVCTRSFQAAIRRPSEIRWTLRRRLKNHRGKGTYWVNEGAATGSPEAWRKAAERVDGSWSTDWSHWLAARAGETVAPPSMGNVVHPPLLDAPGSYVLEK
jgi:poly(3-hydroxyalkanoate) synthetase